MLLKMFSYKTSRLFYGPALVVFFLGVIVSFLSSQWVKDYETRNAKLAFVEITQEITQRYSFYLADYENTLKFLKAIFLSSGSERISAEQYELLSISILLNRPDIKGLHLITDQGGESPLTMEYSSSLSYGQPLQGQNLKAHSYFTQAAEFAFQSNHATAIIPPTPFLGIEDMFVVYPLFQESESTTNDLYQNLAKAYDARAIFLSVSVDAKDFFRETLRTHKEYEGINLTLHLLDAEKDLENGKSPAREVYTNLDTSVDAVSSFVDGHQHTTTLEALSAQWELSFSSQPGYFIREIKNEYFVLLCGILLSLVLGAYIGLSVYQRHKDQKTQEELNERILREQQMNVQMQDYTDKLEDARVEALNAKKKADKANRAKSEFLANMSHELRTPLNSIIGLSKILFEDLRSDEEQEMAGTVNKSAVSLLEIVNDILDISKIEAGSMVLESISFDFKTVLTNVIETMAPIASGKGVSLSFEFVPIDKDKDTYFLGDPLRVGRILTNLVSNAIKYTNTVRDPETGHIKNDGKVSVRAKIRDLGNGQAEIYCAVKDTGIGIEAENLGLIFQKFTQADETITRKFGGTGLGLAITQELVDIMQGEIGVESEINKGSTFWFSIPFTTSDTLHDESEDLTFHDNDIANANKTKVQDARILIAEDHQLNQVFIKKLLKRLGFVHYEIVENGVLAVEAYDKSRKDNTPYDLILMDCHMPEKNGYQATGDIRMIETENNQHSPNTDKDHASHIPIVALTADAMLGTREKCLDAGMDDYISKPIDSQKFRIAMGRWFSFAQTKSGESSANQNTVKETATKTANGASSPLTPKIDPAEIVDFSMLGEYADTEEEKVAFCDVFFTTAKECLGILQDNTKLEANENWVEAAHKLKGGAGIIGAIQLQTLAASAQEMTNEISDQERQDMYEQLVNSYEGAEKILREKLYS